VSRNGKSKHTGSISSVRAIEDCIRATKQYTEGILTFRETHPTSIQGVGRFPSRAFRKLYEVYPDMEIGWDMSASDFLDWLWHETPCINVHFYYDYRANKASMAVVEGAGATQKLRDSIPGLADAMDVLRIGVAGVVLTVASKAATASTKERGGYAKR